MRHRDHASRERTAIPSPIRDAAARFASLTLRLAPPGATLWRVTFATTRWSLVRRAQTGDGNAGCADPSDGAAVGGSSADALRELCELYWPPVYRFFRRAAGSDRHRAEDLTQGLFLRLLDGRSLRQADPERGRFRTWLLACARNHLANERAAANAQKRGGDVPRLPLDFASEEGRIGREPTSTDEGPEQAFARRWVQTLCERVLGALQADFERRGRGELFAAARPFLDPAQDPGPMRAAAAAIGSTEGAFKVAVHRLRERFHERLRDEIAHTLGDRAELADELAHLQALLARP